MKTKKRKDDKKMKKKWAFQKGEKDPCEEMSG